MYQAFILLFDGQAILLGIRLDATQFVHSPTTFVTSSKLHIIFPAAHSLDLLHDLPSSKHVRILSRLHFFIPESVANTVSHR